MPRSPDDPVVRDSQATLWAMMREGLYSSGEVSASGHWHPSRAATPWQSIQAQTPYGQQQRPTKMTLSIVPPSPSTPPVRPPLGERNASEINVLRVELASDDRKRAAREAALRKIDEGVRELKIAEQM